MPRFVLLRHELPPTSEIPAHWDLMLEQNGALLTWRLDEIQPEWALVSRDAVAERVPKAPTSALQLPNHRLAYLAYEGPVSDNRGQVARIDAGAYDMIEQTADRLACTFHGQLLTGEFTLRRTAETRWQLTPKC